MDEQPEIEVALDDYCFCKCHGDCLQTPITTMIIPLGVHKHSPAEAVSACESCHDSHLETGFETDDESWRG